MPSADLLAAARRRGPQRRLRAARSVLAASAAVAAALLLNPGAFERLRGDILQYAGVFTAPAERPPAADVVPQRAPNARPALGQVAGAGDDGADGEAAAPARRNSDGGLANASAAPHAATDGESSLRTLPLASWLAEIAASAKRGLVLAPDLTGEATAAFDTISGWEERLDALARAHGFQYSVDERLIEAWKKPRAADAAVEAVSNDGGPDDHAVGIATPGPDSMHDADGAYAHFAPPPPDEETLEPRATTVARPKHARAADMVAALAKAARAADVQVAADPGSNAVVIAGPEAAVDEMATLLTMLDVPRRRFVLEAEIVELSRSAREELGVQWTIDGTVSPFVDFPAADAEGESSGVIIATDGAHTLRARISALEADGLVRVVSRPRVVVLEGRPASIESVRILRVRFPDRAAVVGEVEDGENIGTGEKAVEEIPVGVVLRVEPSMQGDGRIVLRIRAKSSTLGPPQPPDDIPEELSRMVDAEVAVADGETAVLGGLLREGENRSGTGVPLLRSIPLFGALFGRRKHEQDGEELVVFVTPPPVALSEQAAGSKPDRLC